MIEHARGKKVKVPEPTERRSFRVVIEKIAVPVLRRRASAFLISVLCGIHSRLAGIPRRKSWTKGVITQVGMDEEKSTARVLLQGLLRSVWAYVTAVSTILTVVFLPRQWYWAAALGFGLLILIGAFTAADAIRGDYQRKAKVKEDEIAKLKKENADLKIRPYDEAQRQSVQDKLRKSTVTERDLLRFLLQRGPSRSEALARACSVHPSQLSQALNNLERAGLISRIEQKRPLEAAIDISWQVNPQFGAPLKDLLFPRDEPEKLPHFSA